MITLHIAVKNKVATYPRRDGAIVCGNNDYQIEFTFDEEWQDKTKTARFRWNGANHDVNFTGNICKVPIINDAKSVMVGVFIGAAVSPTLSSTPVVIPCERSILCSGA